MRLIDADALIPTQVHTVVVLKDGREQLESVLYAEQVDDAPTVEPASPWRRVEEGLPPKATWVLAVATDGNVKLFNIATVDAGGQWWTCSPQNILRELYGVRYWMPIEPPKEENK